jgi:very-short-patch-repair endonuclease
MAGRPADTPPTESDAETLFVQIARAIGLPPPRRQFRILIAGREYRIDFAWPELRLAVEIDGSSVHGPRQLGSDLRRQNHIVLDGWMILRFTWVMVAKEPDGAGRVLKRAWDARTIATAI